MTNNVVSLRKFLLNKKIPSAVADWNERHPGLGDAFLECLATNRLFEECTARLRSPDFAKIGLPRDAIQKLLVATNEFVEALDHVTGMIEDEALELASRTMRHTRKQREILLEVMPELQKVTN